MKIFYLIVLFSFTLSPQARAEFQCFNIFQIQEDPLVSIRDLDDLLHTPKVTYLDAYQSSTYQKVLNLVKNKIDSLGIEVEPIHNGEYIDAFHVVPSLKTDLNRIAYDLEKEGQTSVVIPLVDNVFASGMHHSYQINPEARIISIYNISLYQLFVVGWGGRSRFHRHEMRHHQFRQLVVDQIKKRKPIPITTGSISTLVGDGFPETMTVDITLPSKNGKWATRSTYSLSMSSYTKYLSIEEMWTYLRDLQVNARSLSNKLKKTQNANDAILFELNDFMQLLSMVAQINYRFADMEHWKPLDFFSSSLDSSQQMEMRGSVVLTEDLFSKIEHAFYGSPVETGHLTMVTPNDSRMLVSMPLERSGMSSLEVLKQKMQKRISNTVQVAKLGASHMLRSYAVISQEKPQAFSLDPKKRAEVKVEDLRSIAQEVDDLLKKLAEFNQSINQTNNNPF